MTPGGRPQGALVLPTPMEAALAYAARGWRVFPLRGKFPLIPTAHPEGDPLRLRCRGECERDGHGFHDATASPERIKGWWSRWPDAGVGIATGDGLMVVDVDPDHGGAEALAALETGHGQLPRTVEAVTGSGGRHLYFLAPAELRNTAGTLGPGLDTRAAGGYVVAPPSLHPNGRRYQWEASRHPDDLTPAPAPEWLISRLSAPRNGHQGHGGNTGKVPAGRRNEHLASLSGSMRRRGMSSAAIEAALLTENQKALDPPLDDSEVRGIARSIGRYPSDNGHVARTQVSAAQPAGRGDALPWLDAEDGDLPHISELSWKAILQANQPPRLFRHAGLPSRIEVGDDGEPAIAVLSVDKMRHELARVGNWYRDVDRTNQKMRLSAPPPLAVVRDLLSHPDPPLPIVKRVVQAPTFASDGTLHDEPGYNPKTRAFYHPDGLRVGSIPAGPSAVDIAEAVRLITEESIGDFPFTGSAELAHACGLLLLPFVREFIPGPTPLHLIEKPTPGTGAGLLVDVLTWPALGRSPAAMSDSRDEDEWRKRLTARLAKGPSVVLIDNLRFRLDSSALSAALTATWWEDRRLGFTETVKVPIACAWIATANNAALSAEISRRTVRIRLDAHMDRPWEREPVQFRHPNLRAWVIAHRPDLVRAALTLVRAWLTAGRPPGKMTLGSFEAWAEVIGGILSVAGIEGFLANTNELYEASDAEGMAWRAFVSAWSAEYGESVVGTAELYGLLTRGDIGLDLGNGGDHSQRIRLGKQLAAMRDRQFRGYRILFAGTAQRASCYRLERLPE